MNTPPPPAATPAAAHQSQPPLSAASRRRRWLTAGGALRAAAATVGGLALAAAFAPSTWWWSAVIGIALLTLAVHGQRTRAALSLGLLFGLAFYLPLLSWVTVFVGGIALALPVAEALLTAPAVAVMALCTRRLPGWWPVGAAAAWVAGEALRARFPFGGFPWATIAFTQPDGPLLPAAGVIGTPGLSFLTALTGAGLAAAARLAFTHRHRGRPGVPTVAVVAAGLALLTPLSVAWVGRAAAPTPDPSTTVQVAVIQGNVPRPGLDFNAERRAVTDLHARQTAALAQAVRDGTQPPPDLVIWPENSSDIDPYRNQDAYDVIQTAVTDIGVPVLIGAVVQDDDPTSPGTYNQGIVWDPATGPGASYTKRHPVPFAEYMPYRSFFRLFTPWVDSAGYFIPGTHAGNLDIAGVNIGDVICFEVVYDDLVRDVVNGGAQIIVVQTNNATFGYTDETYQQQAMSRVRAVEHARPVLIAATSGVSAIIRPDGSVQDQIPLFTPGYLAAAIPTTSDTTIGTRIGAPIEWTLITAVLLGLGIVDHHARTRRRHHRTTADEPAAGEQTCRIDS